MLSAICSECFHCLWALGLLTCFSSNEPQTWNKYNNVVLNLLVGLFPPTLKLLFMATSDLTLKDPHMVEVPCQDPRHPNKTTSIRVPVILPHELFNWLAENRRLYVSPDAIKQFWKRWSEFQPFHSAAELAVHNPVGISGDDAKYTLGSATVYHHLCQPGAALQGKEKSSQWYQHRRLPIHSCVLVFPVCRFPQMREPPNYLFLMGFWGTPTLGYKPSMSTLPPPPARFGYQLPSFGGVPLGIVSGPNYLRSTIPCDRLEPQCF